MLRPTRATAETERKALSLLATALERNAIEREAWLIHECAADQELLLRVRALLYADAANSSDLAGPNRTEFLQGRRSATEPLLPPREVGPYRLEELIGAGGMGSVYRAQRNDGLFEQAVAIKFIRSHQGLVQLDALVDAERRLLARMEHPAIARILDGGTTANGLHYLVMEFVSGVALDRHVTEHASDTRERVALMIEVCEAVSHAHQNLVLHCDIKPANVLVTAGGRPKLIDFGIARIQDVVDASRPEGFTRAYSSPQRLAGEPAVVADDVYSLGVVLGELLPAESASEVHELSAVVRVATAASRTDRYASVAALATDLSRWLEQRPLAAIGDHWTYRARKFVARRPWRVAAVSVALIGLLTALAVTSTLYRRAEAARTLAEARFGEVRELAKYMIFDLYDQLERVPGATDIRLGLARKGEQYLKRLGAQAEAPFDVRLESGIGLARLGGVLGVPQQPNLGESVAAHAALDQSIAQLGALHATAPNRSDLTLELTRALLLRARLAIWADNSLHTARDLLARAAALLAAESVAAEKAAGVAGNATYSRDRRREVDLLWRHVRAEEADWAGEPRRVLLLAQQTLAVLDAWPEVMKQDERYPLGRSRALNKLADGLYYSGDKAAALQRYQQADALLRVADLRWPNRPAILSQRLIIGWAIATSLANLGRSAEAIPVFADAQRVFERLREFEQRDALLLRQGEVLQAAYGETLSDLGRHDEAIALLDLAVRRRVARALAAPADAGLLRDAAYIYVPLAKTYQRGGRAAEACRAWAESLRRFDALRRAGQLNKSDETEHVVAVQEALQRCPAPAR